VGFYENLVKKMLDYKVCETGLIVIQHLLFYEKLRKAGAVL